MPETEKKKTEISLMANRNGDKMGHEHLDDVIINIKGYTVIVNPLGIAIRFPIRVGRSTYASEPTIIDESLHIDSYGYMSKLFRLEEKS